MKTIAELATTSRTVRATCIQMAHDAREGHLSSALSCTDILVALFDSFLRLPDRGMQNNERDRFILSKGHACSAYYAVLAHHELIPSEMLSCYAMSDSALANHPCKYGLDILEMSSGSLGHGLGFATGRLYGLRLQNNPARCVVLLSDGECNEGSIWEAAMFACAKKLDRLLAIVDHNGTQAVGKYHELTGGYPLAERFKSFGWAVRTVNGHNLKELLSVLDDFPFEKGKPSVIIAETIPGAGVSFMRNDQVWFYRTPSAEELQRALAELASEPIHKGEVGAKGI